MIKIYTQGRSTFSPPHPSPPPPQPIPKYASDRKSDAKHNRHQKGASPVVPGDQVPFHPTPPAPLPIIDMNDTYKSHPKGRQNLGGLMPGTAAIKGCYSSCAWRSDPLPPPT